MMQKIQRISGKVKSFNTKSGYGFITASDRRNVYVNAMDVEDWGLKPRDAVEFDIVRVPLGWAAKNVVITSGRQEETEDDTEAAPYRQSMPPEAERNYKDALVARQQGDTDRARRLFERALQNSSHLNVYLAYAAMEKEAKQLDKALQIYRRGIRELPRVGTLYEHCAMLLRSTGDFDSAEVLLRQGLENAPGYARQLHWWLFKVLADKSDEVNYQEAISHAEQALRLGMGSANDPQYMRISFFTDSKLNSNLYRFLTYAGFSTKIGKVTSQYTDALVSSSQEEYIHAYDLKGTLLVRCFSQDPEKRDDIEGNVLGTLRRPPYRDLNSDVAFVVVRDASPWRATLLRMIEDHREVIVPFDEQSLTLFGNEDYTSEATSRSSRRSELATDLMRRVLDQWLARRDLFQERFPVSGRRFFGREQELQNLVRNIEDGQHTGIYGLRKVGKTSLLYQLKYKRPQDLVVYIDLQHVAGMAQDCAYLYWQIAKKLQDALREKIELGFEVPQLKLKLGTKSTQPQQRKKAALLFDEDIHTLLDSLRQNTSTQNSRIVIAIDELEWMLPTSNGPGFEGYPEFFAYMRGITQVTQGAVISVIAAANPSITEQSTWGDRDNPVFQFYSDMFLPPLAMEECGEMISSLSRGMNVTFSEGAISAIYEETGGHPYVTRQLCSFLVHNRVRPVQITPSDVVSDMDQFLRDRGSIFNEILDRLETHYPVEFDLLKFIAEGVNTESELASLVEGSVDAALRHLIGYQIVHFSTGTYKVKINLLLRWMRRTVLKS